MNKYLEYLELTKTIKIEMMEYLISEGIAFNSKQIQEIDDILFVYYHNPNGFT